MFQHPDVVTWSFVENGLAIHLTLHIQYDDQRLIRIRKKKPLNMTSVHAMRTPLYDTKACYQVWVGV